MTDFKTSDRDVNRAIRSWLHEDRHEDVSRVAGAVLDQVDTIPQRRATRWPARRTPTMNKFLAIGLGAAAVVVALFVGVQIFGSPDGGGRAGEPSATARADGRADSGRRGRCGPPRRSVPDSGPELMIRRTTSRRSRSPFQPLTGRGGRRRHPPQERHARTDGSCRNDHLRRAGVHRVRRRVSLGDHDAGDARDHGG